MSAARVLVPDTLTNEALDVRSHDERYALLVDVEDPILFCDGKCEHILQYIACTAVLCLFCLTEVF